MPSLYSHIVSLRLQSNCSYKEECIVVQLSVTVSALFLFYKNYVNSKFTFDFLPVQPGRQTNFFSLQRLFDLKDILVNSQCSILPAIFVATISFFLGIKGFCSKVTASCSTINKTNWFLLLQVP